MHVSPLEPFWLFFTSRKTHFQKMCLIAFYGKLLIRILIAPNTRFLFQLQGVTQPLSDFRKDMLRLHNIYRLRHGAPPLTVDPILQTFAQRIANADKPRFDFKQLTKDYMKAGGKLRNGQMVWMHEYADPWKNSGECQDTVGSSFLHLETFLGSF